MRLKELRERNNLLQKDVAARLNCSVPVYCRYEKGDRMPSTDTLKDLADYYHVTVDYILGRDLEPAAPTPDPEAAKLAASLEKLSDENLVKLRDYMKLLLLQQEAEERKKG